MFSSSSRRPAKNKAYNIRKSGLKEKFVDRQILVLHRAMAEKLITHPQLRQGVVDTIEARYESGRLRHGAYLTWICLMENVEGTKVKDNQTFINGVLEDSPRMNKLRRQTPFVGVLTEEERHEALMAEACGMTTVESTL